MTRQRVMDGFLCPDFEVVIEGGDDDDVGRL